MPAISIPQPDKTPTDLGAIIQNGIRFAIIIAAILTLLYIIYGGIQWLTSGGDKAKVEEARNVITSGVIGLAIVVAAYAVMTLVAQFFGLDLANLTFPNIFGK